MKLVVISPESADQREIDAVCAMLARGLTRYHVRKLGWTDQALAAWVEAFSTTERLRLVWHGAEALAKRLGFGGAHWRDDAGAPTAFESGVDRTLPVPHESRFLRSRSCHDLKQLCEAIGVYDAVFLSPVFPSLSKPGHGETRAWTDRELQCLLSSRDAAAHRTEVIALGGIQKSTTARCRELGFDGAAALGGIWSSPDPVAAFVELRDAFSAVAGAPLFATSTPAISASHFS